MKRYPKTVACMLWFGQRVMLAQRLDTKTFSGYWEAVGGKVEEGEEVTDAMVREIKEEADISVYRYHLEIVDCITNDPTTDKCFIFRSAFVTFRFLDVENKERRKRTRWQLFTPEEALKLKLMPGLAENMKQPILLA